MEAMSIYKKNYHVVYGDSDFYKKLKLSSLFNYFQDISSLHSENIGIGIESIQQNHSVAWVMVRIMVDIVRMPNWNEKIKVETWPIEPKRLEFERNFIVRDVEGNVLVKAISIWVIMDIEKREIRKTELISVEYPPFLEERAINQRMGKPKPSGQLELVYKKLIGYSDIDINGHLNNSKYIDYITDCFSMENHGEYTVESIQVSYINEAIAGDTISFYKDIPALNSAEIYPMPIATNIPTKSKNTVYVEGVNAIGGKVYFKSSITIK
ncbi:MAG TPA: acyl-ACP thioesterase domain-containing protein [Ruminiclostridium sp.]